MSAGPTPAWWAAHEPVTGCRHESRMQWDGNLVCFGCGLAVGDAAIALVAAHAGPVGAAVARPVSFPEFLARARREGAERAVRAS